VYGFNDQPGAVAILGVGGMDRDPDQQTGSVGHDVALAAPGLRRGRLLTLLAAS
jgi:hypothetical protein